MTWAALLDLLVPAAIAGAGFLVKWAIDRAAKQIDDLKTFGREIDTDLREKRHDVYRELWTMTKIVPKYPAPNRLEFAALSDFSYTLRDWYFETGGIYMSEAARDRYFEVQEVIQSVQSEKRSPVLEPAQYDRVREACSKLRTELARDLQSRRPAPVPPA